MSRECLGQCFVSVLLTVCFVRVSCSVFIRSVAFLSL